MVRVAVTGGAGFIGHHLVRGLLDAGHAVVVVDDFSTGQRARLRPLANQVRVLEASVLDGGALDDAFEGCDVVYHEAAIASVARSTTEPLLVNQVNVDGTIEVMLAATRARVRRVVLAGSSAVYGTLEPGPSREDQPLDPVSPYGVSKLAAEHYAHALGRLGGVETVALRYFNVYGPGQDPEAEYAAVIPRFINAVLAGRQPVINGSAEITRDFVYVGDVVRANLLAGSSTSTAVTCNIASGRPTSLGDLVTAIGEAVGRSIVPVLGPPRPGDIRHSRADISLAGELLGYLPRVPLEEGIARTLEWYDQESGHASQSLGRPATTT